ncbi:hypothetical protein KEM60_02551 [Austwickia sp. TVS 96-490-7B]|uniref:sulfotransferase domain-containing protein n=1 Tax=Austwickia sp. TVS 96-490-7B TaxID=2830843 RepID=UPI001C59EC31|nr:hypothetical protein [Austwickia sp. TVS 96-490-7B]
MRAADPIRRHRENLANFTGESIAVASYPGAGAAYLGNLLICSGFGYLDPYTERVGGDGRTSAFPDQILYRSRIAGYHAQDSAGTEAQGRSAGVWVKTHLSPQDFPELRSAVLLVRDPRDTLFSYYNWRRAFSEEGEEREFDEFMAQPHPLGLPPAQHWAQFHRVWLCALTELPTKAVVRFEELKAEPVAVVSRMLRKLGQPIPDEAVLRAAADQSSFESMRRHEDRTCADSRRVMRRGQPGEWREWYTVGRAAHFEESDARDVALQFGYDVGSVAGEVR